MRIRLRSLELAGCSPRGPIHRNLGLHFIRSRLSASCCRNLRPVSGRLWSPPAGQCRRSGVRMAGLATMLGGRALNSIGRGLSTISAFTAFPQIVPTGRQAIVLGDQTPFDLAGFSPRRRRTDRLDAKVLCPMLRNCPSDCHAGTATARGIEMFNPPTLNVSRRDANIDLAVDEAGDAIGLKCRATHVESSNGILDISADISRRFFDLEL